MVPRLGDHLIPTPQIGELEHRLHKMELSLMEKDNIWITLIPLKLFSSHRYYKFHLGTNSKSLPLDITMSHMFP